MNSQCNLKLKTEIFIKFFSQMMRGPPDEKIEQSLADVIHRGYMEMEYQMINKLYLVVRPIFETTTKRPRVELNGSTNDTQPVKSAALDKEKIMGPLTEALPPEYAVESKALESKQIVEITLIRTWPALAGLKYYDDSVHSEEFEFSEWEKTQQHIREDKKMNDGPKDYRQREFLAWEKWLSRYDWGWIATLTVEDDWSVMSLQKKIKTWIRDLEKTEGIQVGCAVAICENKGHLHAHLLCVGRRRKYEPMITLANLNPRRWSDRWPFHAKIEHVDDPFGASRYVALHKVKRKCDECVIEFHNPSLLDCFEI